MLTRQHTSLREAIRNAGVSTDTNRPESSTALSRNPEGVPGSNVAVTITGSPGTGGRHANQADACTSSSSTGPRSKIIGTRRCLI